MRPSASPSRGPLRTTLEEASVELFGEPDDQAVTHH